MVSTRRKSDVKGTVVPNREPNGPVNVDHGKQAQEVQSQEKGQEIETGEKILAQAAEEPTLDRYLDRNPALLTDQDYVELVAVLQKQRTMFITAEAKKGKGKSEIEENENGESDVQEG